MSVRRAQNEIDSREFAQWQAFGQIEPFGEVRDDMRAAMIACTIANVFRGKNKAAYQLDRFMLKFNMSSTKNRQSPDDMKSMLFAFAREHNRAISSEHEA